MHDGVDAGMISGYLMWMLELNLRILQFGSNGLNQFIQRNHRGGLTPFVYVLQLVPSCSHVILWDVLHQVVVFLRDDVVKFIPSC